MCACKAQTQLKDNFVGLNKVSVGLTWETYNPMFQTDRVHENEAINWACKPESNYR